MSDHRFDFSAILTGDASKAALAGAAGGLVRWITLRSDWREGVGAIFVGALCALYLGPIVQPLLEPTIGALAPGGDPDGFAAFVVGLGGISLTGFILDIFTRRKGGEDEQK